MEEYKIMLIVGVILASAYFIYRAIERSRFIYELQNPYQVTLTETDNVNYSANCLSSEISDAFYIQEWKNNLSKILVEEDILKLKSLMSKEDHSLCEHCIDDEIREKNIEYLSDTGVCASCRRTQDVLFMPLLRLYEGNMSLDPVVWYNNLPRRGVDIQAIVR